MREHGQRPGGHQEAPATQLDCFWYIVARSRDLGSAPLERRVNGRRLALFRDGSGRAVALDARCPHRGANLAHGRVEDGYLACPYHGWRWDGAGRCRRIPSAPPDLPVPSSFVTTSYPVIEQQGFLWVLPGVRAAAPPPVFPELDEIDLHPFFCEEVVDAPFDWWVENSFDIAHVPYVHGRTFGGENSARTRRGVEWLPGETSELAFRARAVTGQQQSLLTRLLHRSAPHHEIRPGVRFHMPGTVIFDTDLGGGRRQVLFFLATPEDGRRTRIWIGLLRNYLRVPLADTVGRWLLRMLIREDVTLARASVTRISLEQNPRFNCGADLPSVEFLRLLRLWRAREGIDPVRPVAGAGSSSAP